MGGGDAAGRVQQSPLPDPDRRAAQLVLFFCYAAVFALLQRRRSAGTGAVAAFAFLFKLAPGILLPYFGWQAIGEVVSKKKNIVSRGIPGRETVEEKEHGRDARTTSTVPSSGCAALDARGSWGHAFSKNATFRSALWMVLFTGVFLTLSVAWVGWDQHRAFRPLLEQMGYGRSTWTHHGWPFIATPRISRSTRCSTTYSSLPIQRRRG
jgi:hypothetical protein